MDHKKALHATENSTVYNQWPMAAQWCRASAWRVRSPQGSGLGHAIILPQTQAPHQRTVILLDKFIAQQLRRPSGLLGRLFMGALLNRANARHIQQTIELLGLQANDYVLDAGFGGGHSFRLMLPHLSHGWLAGVDVAPIMVQQAARRFAVVVRAGKLTLCLADIAHLPYRQGRFDKICTINTIYFWDDPIASLAELRGILTADGQLVVAIEAHDQRQAPRFTQYGFAHYTPDELQHLLYQAGFSHCTIVHGDQCGMPASIFGIARP
jgi:SAM-dependent methyltransferase